MVVLFAVPVLAVAQSGLSASAALEGELHKARTENLLALPRPVVASRDARPSYEAAIDKYDKAGQDLGYEFEKAVNAPTPQIVRYLAAMARASEHPDCSKIPNESDGRPPYHGGTPSYTLLTAARGLIARAKNKDELLAAARIARHLRRQPKAVPVGYGSILVSEVLDHADRLRLRKSEAKAVLLALGTPLGPREALRRQFADEIESLLKESNIRLRERAAANLAYVRFWRGFFARTDEGEGFVNALAKFGAEVEAAELSGGKYQDPAGYVALPSERSATLSDERRWSLWAKRLQRANARLSE